ncbi:MAG: DNA-binding ferritin-like protein [Parvicella sp.]|jgi:DNA-binding ferritin-like protein
MTKNKSQKQTKQDIETELKGLIEQNQNLTKGIKKIIKSIEKKKPNK